jgi:hypothetical protein
MSNVAAPQAPPTAAGNAPVVAPPGPIRPPAPKTDFAALAAQALAKTRGGTDGAAAGETPAATETPAASADGTATDTPAAAPLDPKAVAAAVVAGRKHQEKLRRELAQTRQREELAAAEARQYREQATGSQRILDQLRAGGDPSAALQALGVSPEALAKAAIESGSPAAQLKAIQDQLAQERRAREALVRELQGEKAAQVRAKVEDAFYSAAQDEKRYPNLSKQPKAVILQMGDYLANQASAKGERYTFSDLLESLEYLYKGGGKTNQANLQATATGIQGAGAGSGKPPTRTITSADTTSSASTPIDLKSLPPAARYKEVERLALERIKKK